MASQVEKMGAESAAPSNWSPVSDVLMGARDSAGRAWTCLAIGDRANDVSFLLQGSAKGWDAVAKTVYGLCQLGTLSGLFPVEVDPAMRAFAGLTGAFAVVGDAKALLDGKFPAPEVKEWRLLTTHNETFVQRVCFLSAGILGAGKGLMTYASVRMDLVVSLVNRIPVVGVLLSGAGLAGVQIAFVTVGSAITFRQTFVELISGEKMSETDRREAVLKCGEAAIKLTLIWALSSATMAYAAGTAVTGLIASVRLLDKRTLEAA